MSAHKVLIPSEELPAPTAAPRHSLGQVQCDFNAKTEMPQVKLTDKSLYKLRDCVTQHQSPSITTADLANGRFNPFGSGKRFKTWDEWALWMGLKVYDRRPSGPGYTLTFSTVELAERIGIKKEFPALPAPTAAPRHSLDQVLRDFNVTVDGLHQLVGDSHQSLVKGVDLLEVRAEERHSEIVNNLLLVMEQQDKQQQVLRIFFKRLELVQKQQEVLMQELGVASPAIVN